METFKKHSETELEITIKGDIKIFESLDATLSLIAEKELGISNLQNELVQLYARRDEGIRVSLKTKYEVDEESRIAKEAEQEVLKASLDEVVE